MALPTSGVITLNDVNVELGLSGTSAISMGDAAVRGLFGIASGEIEMSDGHGKSDGVTGAFVGAVYSLNGTGSIAGWTPQAGDIVLFSCTTWAYDNPVGGFSAPSGYTMVNYKVSAAPWSGTYRASARLGYRICDGSENPATLPRGYYGSAQGESFWTVYRFSQPVQSVSLAVNSGSTSSGGSATFAARSGPSLILVGGAGYNISSPWATTSPTQDYNYGAGNNQFASKLLDGNTSSSTSWSTSAFRPATAYTVFSPSF